MEKLKKIRDDSKYITADEFNKFSGEIFDERLKQGKLVTTNDLNTFNQLATKNEVKIEKLQTYNSSILIGKVTLAMMDHNFF